MKYFNFTSAYFSIIGLFSIFAIYTKYKKPRWFFVTKPIPILLVILTLSYFIVTNFSSIKTDSMPISIIWLLLGLVSGLIGDLFLLKEGQLKKGIYAFLAGQIFYLIAFSRAQWNLPIWIIFLLLVFAIVYGALLSYQLNIHMENEFILPVWLYIIAILSMLAASINWQIDNPTSGIPYFPLGAFLFCISDTLIGFNRFIKPFKWTRIFILLFYYSGQSFIGYAAIVLLK